MYKLIIQDDEGKTTVVPLIREELTIGRQEGNTIRLTERNVSRRHAKLLRGAEAIVIEDLDSYNGVRVNGTRIQGKAEIKEADRVQIGDYLIEVKAEQPVPAVDAHAGTVETVQMPVIDAAPVPVVAQGSEAVTAPNPAPAASPGSDNFAAEAVTASAAPPTGTTPLAEENGRLVILSTGMAGQDFELDKPAMVIGRTDENDICVNHRSISRHHAKVVRENGTYSVVDLHSANGVRVNGEEYGKVELRQGDLVDLGHVRFRYVAPNEDFLFGRDAQAVDIATEGKGGKGLWIALLLIMAGVIAFLALSGDDKKPEQNAEKPIEPTNVITDPPPVVDPIIEEAIDAGAQPVVDSNAKYAGHIEAALAARDDNKWNVMLAEANKALEVDSTGRKAAELAQQAKFESTNQRTFDSFQGAVGTRKWAQVASHFENIDPASVYKVQAQPDHDRLKAEYAEFQLVAAEKAASRKKCSEISRVASRVPSQWPEIAQKISNVSCTRVSSNNNNNNNNNTKPDVTPPDPPPVDGPPFEELVSQAQSAIKGGNYGKGMQLCNQALDLKPNSEEAAMICGIAACNLKKGAAAKRYMRRIRGASRKAGLRQICLTKGVPGFE
jgi:pSer/pThr/pTyr-binding forkhead associated (FHA) protein